ncbi:Ribosomal protein S18 acetylase RimI [Flaviramulus basaltis]|uniref:Ribosomal protein S18 acetylase RimI n=1 Tax=Flaviramulus basaltis TaxID=369401 RepID=A0A1K2IHX6_9FLAO|nr:GNAT family N-acetyltransferase [Flaviramulus basaltis]SFZ91874.1 Ribosomal protein S18 acetylase RimI [Flaviramulus basaltis]
MTEIIPAQTGSDYLLIETLADTIWREHYPSIISIKQINYMLKKFNSASAIENQIKEGFLFFYIIYDNIPVGYLSIKIETDYLFLSKFYVLKDFRGKGIGRYAFNFICELAVKFDLSSISLNVNKYNIDSIRAYEKLGFQKVRAMVTDIGKGFIMDDYEMEKTF